MAKKISKSYVKASSTGRRSTSAASKSPPSIDNTRKPGGSKGGNKSGCSGCKK